MKKLLLIILTASLLAATPAAAQLLTYSDDFVEFGYYDDYYYQVWMEQDDNGVRTYYYDLFSSKGEVVSRNYIKLVGKPQLCDDLAIALEDFDMGDYIESGADAEGEILEKSILETKVKLKNGKIQTKCYLLDDPVSFAFTSEELTGDEKVDDCIEMFAIFAKADCGAYDKHMIGGTKEEKVIISELLPPK